MHRTATSPSHHALTAQAREHDGYQRSAGRERKGKRYQRKRKPGPDRRSELDIAA
jgi:hypothetical protein